MQQDQFRRNNRTDNQAEAGSTNGSGNVKAFPPPASGSANSYEQVNRFDQAQWNQIVTDISKLEVARAVILVMDQRDNLKSLYPSVYIRAHQTCIAFERKEMIRARRIATARKFYFWSVAVSSTALSWIGMKVAHLVNYLRSRAWMN